MGHTPEQRVAASALRRYSFGLRLAIAQADSGPFIPIFFQIGFHDEWYTSSSDPEKTESNKADT